MRPLRVVLLFQVLNFPEDYAGGQYISIIASNTNQSGSLETLIFVIKIFTCHFVHAVYKLLDAEIWKFPKACGQETRKGV